MLRYLAVIGLCFFVGCASLPFRKKDLQIDYSNGINMVEAISIAKPALRGSDKAGDYKENSATVLRSLMVRPYPGHWFVEFGPKKFTMSFWSYLIVIEKESGKVIYSDAYIPLEISDYDWLFEGAGEEK